MTEQKIPTGEMEKQSLKDIFFGQLKKAFEDLVKTTVNAKNLGIVILAWFVLSISVSIWRRIENRCDVHVQASKYIYSDLLCPEK